MIPANDKILNLSFSQFDSSNSPIENSPPKIHWITFKKIMDKIHQKESLVLKEVNLFVLGLQSRQHCVKGLQHLWKVSNASITRAEISIVS